MPGPRHSGSPASGSSGRAKRTIFWSSLSVPQRPLIGRDWHLRFLFHQGFLTQRSAPDVDTATGPWERASRLDRVWAAGAPQASPVAHETVALRPLALSVPAGSAAGTHEGWSRFFPYSSEDEEDAPIVNMHSSEPLLIQRNCFWAFSYADLTLGDVTLRTYEDVRD